jgi:7-keto-8-aminopelargonate synthetase-like enzyme
VANHIMVQALADRVDAVFVDEASHFCVMEAASLAGKRVTCFAHRNPADLARHLRAKLESDQRPLVLTDAVFPVSGALAPVTDYARELEGYRGAVLHLDDAHGFGVLGPQGRGILDHFGLWDRRVNGDGAAEALTFTVCGTLAKALGGFGGIIPGTREFIRRVRSASHYYDGASAPSSGDAGAAAEALKIARQQPELRAQLRVNNQHLRSGLRQLGLEVDDGPSANFGVRIGRAPNMRRLHAELRAAGYIVPYVSAYSGLGPEGALRFAVCALHTAKMIDGLLTNLKNLLQDNTVPCAPS